MGHKPRAKPEPMKAFAVAQAGELAIRSGVFAGESLQNIQDAMGRLRERFEPNDPVPDYLAGIARKLVRYVAEHN